MKKKLLPLAMLSTESPGSDWSVVMPDKLEPQLIYPYGEKLATCPACRGYNLERQWCQHCNQSGAVWLNPNQGEPVSDFNIYLSPQENIYVDNKN
ncbi:hypothetical protein [Gilvimarinus chinensis]|uniref:hypothetical protein n=1 Tax=Gilvimarinus chinensis TaxID=396005 RepID=UPI000372F1E6|nr:hypothetical protein [Gilvimarinus chinensis]